MKNFPISVPLIEYVTSQRLDNLVGTKAHFEVDKVYDMKSKKYTAEMRISEVEPRVMIDVDYSDAKQKVAAVIARECTSCGATYQRVTHIFSPITVDYFGSVLLRTCPACCRWVIVVSAWKKSNKIFCGGVHMYAKVQMI